MPNPWTGIGNPYTKQEVVDRLKATLAKGEPIIAAGALGAASQHREGGMSPVSMSDFEIFRAGGHDDGSDDRLG